MKNLSGLSLTDIFTDALQKPMEMEIALTRIKLAYLLTNRKIKLRSFLRDAELASGQKMPDASHLSKFIRGIELSGRSFYKIGAISQLEKAANTHLMQDDINLISDTIRDIMQQNVMSQEWFGYQVLKHFEAMHKHSSGRISISSLDLEQSAVPDIDYDDFAKIIIEVFHAANAPHREIVKDVATALENYFQ